MRFVSAAFAALMALGLAPAAAQPAGMAPAHIAAVKRMEGFSAKPYWDYAQWSIGYGTKAYSADDVVDEEEAERRLFAELSKAAAFVDARFKVDPGTRDALISFTYNTGTGWASRRLGELVRAGDLDGAKQVMLQYVNAGGKQLSGLVDRRRTEVSWFGAIAAPIPVSVPTKPFPADRECVIPAYGLRAFPKLRKTQVAP